MIQVNLANIQPFVNKHRIGGYNFGIQLFCALDGKGRFSRCRTAANDQNFCHYSFLLNIFSSSVLVIFVTTGLPWGQ